ncbi:MAG TPA: NADAR family protein [Chitinophagales bacterium]|nr:NADAR family protein [Chitinophagales bacterium]
MNNQKNMKEEFIFYFGPDSVFSHWYKCNFAIDGKNYCCVEQYIMYKKAILFNDLEIANKILHSSDPQRHRYLGKQVAGFIKSVWQNECKQYAYEANYAKFTESEKLMKALVDTKEKSLAEASPYDRNWGIGLSVANPRNQDRKNWRGKNWCGEVLELVRRNILMQG